MPRNTVGESLQVFLSILTDTVLDQVMDRDTSLSQEPTPPASQPSCQFRAIRNDFHDENTRVAFSPIQFGSGRDIQFSR